MQNQIPLSVPNFNGNETGYVLDAISSGWVSTGGKYIDKFEKSFAKYAGIKNAVACQNGTAGLHLALIEADVKKDDIVIAPTLTFIASIAPIIYVNAEPVFMDCDDSLCIDVSKIENYIKEKCVFQDGILKRISDNKIVKAILPVHLFGNNCDIEKIIEIANAYNLIVIEDAAEAVGSFYNDGKMVGTTADFGVYSFNGNKIITTGGGGMVVAKNENQLNHIKYLSTTAKDDALYYVHNEIGFNYRMTNIQAALGVAQLEKIEQFIRTKKENYFEYKKEGIDLLSFNSAIRPNYWFYSHLTDDRDTLLNILLKNNIQARPIWKLSHKNKPYEKFENYKIEKAYDYYKKIVNIPCSSNLKKEEVKRVSDLIKNFRV
ncbi:MAG: LegC family aminotransferase [Clostridiales Family XIII bacterium]|jgi:perosamine synthetase|nr:LegC family aminotransferase [Clostridiales Family XIII bacterium]